MHELSIAMSLVDLACDEMARRQLGPIKALHLRLGSRSGVVGHALLFSFEVAAAGTAVDGAVLKVEETAGTDLELFALELAE